MSRYPMTWWQPRLRQFRRSGTGFMAECPAHDDHNPSLSLDEGNDHNAVVICRAGCTYESILSALGVIPGRNGTGRTERRIVTEYNYFDEEGELLYQVLRLTPRPDNPKPFSQRRPDGRGGWIWNLDGVRRVLYHLQEVLDAVEQGRTIYIPEGEKDVETLRGWLLDATTNSGGAGQWRPEFTEMLRGAQVILLPDNDAPGHLHMAQVRAALAGVAASVKIVELPDLPEGGDVTDWLRTHTMIEFRDLVENTPDAPPPEPQAEPAEQDSEPSGYHCTDLGNAERLVAAFGSDLLYNDQASTWLIWTGTHWDVDQQRTAFHCAIETVRGIYTEAAQATDPDKRQALAAWAVKSESGQHIRDMVSLARSLTGIPILYSDLDTDPWLFNVQNGTIDLRTGEPRPHSKTDYLTKIVPIEYDPRATCPTWLAFLDRIFKGDADQILFVQRALGYSLTGDVREEVFFFLFGSGQNGKSTLLETIFRLVGPYGSRARTEALMAHRDAGEGHSESIARLRGARFVTAAETREWDRLNETLIKDLTGGDTISARRIHERAFDFQPQFKLWLYGNHKPSVRDDSEGMWRRVRLIPFEVQIPENERDPTLKGADGKLARELPGILNWALAGCAAWLRDGLGTTEQVRQATSEYRSESDIFQQWLTERCELKDEHRTSAAKLYSDFEHWWYENGEYGKPWSKRRLGDRLTQRGFKKYHGSGGLGQVYRGIGVLEPWTEQRPSGFTLHTRGSGGEKVQPEPEPVQQELGITESA